MTVGFGSGIFVVTQDLPDALVGVPYDTYTLDALDYTPPISWALFSGSLPPGMTLNPAGQLAGSPTTVGVYTFTVRATDGVPDTKDKTLTIRVVPNLGTVRRYQQESVVEQGTSVVPIEGSLGVSALRRSLERLLARVQGSQINNRFMLDAVDLQIRAFNAVPVQSVDDALNLLLGMITGFADGANDTTGLPSVTPDVNGDLNFFGIAPIVVAKNIPMNRIDISFSGAALNVPFTVLPAPSGDLTGATDTANFNTMFAGSHQDWLVSPQDVADSAYYINADILTAVGTRLYRITGKNRDAFRIVGVGALRTFNQIRIGEHANLTNIAFRGNNTLPLTQYRDCRIDLSIAAAVLVSLGRSARFSDCFITFGNATAMLFDTPNEVRATDCVFQRTVGNASSVIGAISAGTPSTLDFKGCAFVPLLIAGQRVLDLSSSHANTIITLGVNTFYNVGVGGATPILRGITPALLGSQYVEAVQAFVSAAPLTPLV